MGGRGTYASGKDVEYTYESIGEIGGIKVLVPIGKGSLSLPEESHSSSSYISLDKNGVFKQLRVYNEKHEAIFEIGYHNEPKLIKGVGKVLHVHIYNKPGEINHKNATSYLIGPGDKYYEEYKHVFKGVEL